ncbi:MAG: hypothetical protein ACOY5Y_06400 [Pseudomonadota bacterium]|jgi:hypothetical protein
MSKPPPGGGASPAVRFRGQIEAALAEGHTVTDLTLRLTRRDRSLLVRDHDLAVGDISYAGGEMRFLGVQVEEGGGVATSFLDRGEGSH